MNRKKRVVLILIICPVLIVVGMFFGHYFKPLDHYFASAASAGMTKGQAILFPFFYLVVFPLLAIGMVYAYLWLDKRFFRKKAGDA